ncbi:MAG: nucleotidyltransferase family protein [Pseudomonadota bacterium]
MILAAGRGSRLRPLTDTTPKPMLPIGGKPLIEWQIEKLAAAGVTGVVINLHHLGEQIREHLDDGSRFDLEIAYSEESALLETGGGVVQALPLLGDEPFWLLNGDIWSDFDFTTLPQTPPGGNKAAHIVLTPTPGHRDGDFDFADGWVTQRGAGYVYCGIALYTPQLFGGERPLVFSLRDLLFDLLAQQRLSGQIHSGEWHDIGNLDQYQQLQSRSR